MRVKRQIVSNVADFRKRDVSDIDTIIIHRSGPWPKQYGNPQTVADLEPIFADKTLGTGGKLPYHFLYNPDQDLFYQGIPLDRIGPHAAAWNEQSIGIAVLRDLRHRPLEPLPLMTLVLFTSLLKRWLVDEGLPGFHVQVAGHTELKGSTKDLTKECPGRQLDMEYMRKEVGELYNNLDTARDDLLILGAKLP